MADTLTPVSCAGVKDGSCRGARGRSGYIGRIPWRETADHLDLQPRPQGQLRCHEPVFATEYVGKATEFCFLSGKNEFETEMTHRSGWICCDPGDVLNQTLS